MPDFSTWSRRNLEDVATDLAAENRLLRADVELLLDAWRDEVSRQLVRPVQQPGTCGTGPTPPPT